MQCSRCKKKEATIHYAEIVDGQIKKLDLCETCAQEIGVGGGVASVQLSGFLSGLMEDEKSKTSSKNACSACKMTYEDFKRTGRLGCAKCYEAFEDGLTYLIETIHKNQRHVGKVPKSALKEFESISRLEKLEQDLKQAIETENFEQAARFRDEIRNFKKNKKK